MSSENPSMYLVRAACPWCGEVVNHVTETDEPIQLMQDVPVETHWCPECGDPVGIGAWDVHEESEIERVTPEAKDA